MFTLHGHILLTDNTVLLQMCNSFLVSLPLTHFSGHHGNTASNLLG